MKKIPSPCIDVCKFRLKGHCIGCSMTKVQKKVIGKNGDRAMRDLAFIVKQQTLLGRFKGWEKAYRRKCEKKGVPCPLDTLAHKKGDRGKA